MRFLKKDGKVWLNQDDLIQIVRGSLVIIGNSDITHNEKLVAKTTTEALLTYIKEVG